MDDPLNEQVAEDGVMNVNRWCTDDSVVESHKMTSWTHQVMSQGQQGMGTTQGQSQKLKTSETV